MLFNVLCPLSFFQSNTVLHLDLVTGAVRRLMLSPDSDQPPTRASNWWSSKEQQVRGFRVSEEKYRLACASQMLWSLLFSFKTYCRGHVFLLCHMASFTLTLGMCFFLLIWYRLHSSKSATCCLQGAYKMCREFAHKNWILFYKEDG